LLKLRSTSANGIAGYDDDQQDGLRQVAQHGLASLFWEREPVKPQVNQAGPDFGARLCEPQQCEMSKHHCKSQPHYIAKPLRVADPRSVFKLGRCRQLGSVVILILFIIVIVGLSR
jgi:hypothetical protein